MVCGEAESEQLYRMPTANERKALWFLALVATSGTAVRLWREPRPSNAATAPAALDRQLHRVDSVRSVHRPAAPARAPTQPIDLDRAGLAEIDALPGMSRTVAERIVADRDSLGPFGSLDALCWRVRGVGPGTVKRLRPLVTFSAAPSPVSGECGEASKATRKSRRSAQRQSR